MSLPITDPYPLFLDLQGDPLQGGLLYFGVVNQNPETAPTTVYWDSALTQPAAQPISTINGFPVRSGTPAQLFISGNYSLTVRDSTRALVYSALSSPFADAILGTSFTWLSPITGVDTLAANSLVVSAYQPGLTVRFLATANNTGPMTLNINGLGAVAMTKNGASALGVNDVFAGRVIQLTYDGTNFQVSSGAGSSSSGSGSSGGVNANGRLNSTGYQNDAFVDANFTIGQDAQAACTISIATPCVITQDNQFTAGQLVRFTTTGALPTGITANGGPYYVMAAGLSASAYQISLTEGGAAINTTGSQSGTHTCGALKHIMLVGPFRQATGTATTIPTGSRIVVL